MTIDLYFIEHILKLTRSLPLFFKPNTCRCLLALFNSDSLAAMASSCGLHMRWQSLAQMETVRCLVDLLLNTRDVAPEVRQGICAAKAVQQSMN
jgi:hypothetical protein